VDSPSEDLKELPQHRAFTLGKAAHGSLFYTWHRAQLTHPRSGWLGFCALSG